MIDLYSYTTINGQAVAIALELMKLAYRTHVVDLRQGEQQQAEFLAINPSGRIPVIVDDLQGKPVVISQTGAILIYLAEKSNRLLSQEVQQRSQTLQWMQFVLTDISTNVFNNFHLKALVSPKQPEAGEILKQRALKFCQEIEQQLKNNTYVAGQQLSLADVVAFPVITQLKGELLNGQCANISRWYEVLAENQSIATGMKVGSL